MKIILPLCLLLLLAASCKKQPGGGAPTQADVVYLESNDYQDNQNKIIAYVNTGAGGLVSLPGSPYPAGGSGVGDPTQALGPLDADNQLKISPDGRFLLAVNSGSNSIAVFAIKADGQLEAVSGSPFPSGGQTPVSIGIDNQYVYVVNKSNDLVHTITLQPNYTVFTIDSKGALTPLPNSTIETTAGTSPSEALVSLDGRFLFGSDWLGFMLSPAQGTLRSFTIGGNGKLTVASAPETVPGVGALGMTQNPRDNTLYVGFPVKGQVAVYIIHDDGTLTYDTAVASGTAACWLRTNHGGDNLYALNSGENTISVFNTADTKVPVLLDKVTLKDPGPLYTAMGANFTTSEDFSFEVSPEENYVYVVSQFTNADFNLPNYNYLHVLSVGSEGNLTEGQDPVLLPVANTFRPTGVAVVHVGGINK
jgi:6-phosphogluconolactonase (cycloisomerase 2 family)